MSESFTYDPLNRLQSATGPYGTLDYDYDELGNIRSKSNVGSYTYGTPRPHAVTAVTGTLNGAITYDNNGSQVSRTGDLARFELSSGTPDEVVYVDGIYEKVTTGSLVEHKHYISGPSGLVAIYTGNNRSQPSLVYVTTDHLGSVDALASTGGAEVDRSSFDPFGQRRSPTSWAPVDPRTVWSLTTKGFTGHDQEDGAALVHMGARVYDPILGRFLSPDAFVDGVDAQGLNRYSYVGNNPLGYTDPTGNFKLKNLLPGGISLSGYFPLGGEISINWTTGGFRAGVGIGLGGDFTLGASSYSYRASVSFGYDSEANQTYVKAGGGVGPASADLYVYQNGDPVLSVGVGVGTQGPEGGLGASIGAGWSSRGGVSFNAGYGYSSGDGGNLGGSSLTAGIGVQYTPRTGNWSGSISASYVWSAGAPRDATSLLRWEGEYAFLNDTYFVAVDIDKVVEWLDNNALNASTRQCATYVRKALEAGGADMSIRPKYAKDYGPKLQDLGFSPISRDNYVPQKGDFTVFGPANARGAGHIQVYDGKGWVSDFFQRRFFPGRSYEGVKYEIFR